MEENNTVQSYHEGAYVYRGDGSPDYILHPEGVVRATGQGLSHEYFLKDHLGSTRVVFNGNGAVLQATDYYAFGLEHTPKAKENENRYLYNGKELQDETFAGGVRLGWYDYGARFYDPMIGRWHSRDILSEMHYDYTPYAYVYNNPVKLLDPFGLDSTYYNEAGTQIYRATGDQGKTSYNYVIKTTQTTEEMYDGFPENHPQRGNSNPISEKSAQTTEELIKSGNLTGDHMGNVVKLYNEATMEAMVKIVSKDDGTGGTSANNNREYIGKLSNGKVVEEAPGPVGDPSKGNLATSTTTATSNEISFHSHPSGRNGVYGWGQPPSRQDITTTTGRVNYVFGMRGQTIYVYNKTGVIATIPIGVFKK